VQRIIPVDYRVGEEWKQILEAPDYFLSNLGRVRRRAVKDASGRQLLETLIIPNNARIDLRVDGKRFSVSLAPLLLTYFVGPCPEGCKVARHLDDDRSNNHISNLAWGTQSQNIFDCIRNGHFKGHTGIRHSEETKNKISVAKKGNPSPKKGIPLSEETKKKISATKLRRSSNG
jgi:hypothetical protein